MLWLAAELGKDGIDPKVTRSMKAAQLHPSDEGFAKAEQMLGVSPVQSPGPWPTTSPTRLSQGVVQGCEPHRA